MKRRTGSRFWGAVAFALLFLAGLVIWQREALARWAIVTTVERLVNVRISLGPMTLRTDRAVFEDVRVTSLRDEPIATIARLSIAYDLRDLFPGGQRRFGLKGIEAATPHLTIIRRPDGSYNVPLPRPPATQAKNQRPWILSARVTDGSIDVVDRSREADADHRYLYVEHLEASAEISTAGRSHYGVKLQYGERRELLFPVHGRGDINPQQETISHRWTAAELPITAAVNFAINSRALRLRSGTLRDVDARYVALADSKGALQPHLGASAVLTGGRIAIGGLAKPVAGVRGRVDAYDDGLLAQRLDASLAGVPVVVSGGLYGLRDPRLRIAVRGNGELSRLRTAFAQAAHLPVQGLLTFALLVEGAATKPLVWIDLRSPKIAYATATLDRVNGLLAYDGRDAAVLGLRGSYGRIGVTARGRVALEKEPGAIDMIASVRAPADALPYAATLLPGMPLSGLALATANDPRAIATRGVLYGAGATQELDAIFNVDSRGFGSIGPLNVRSSRGSVYGRVALDRPHGSSLGLFQARNFAVVPARASLNATFFGGDAKPGITLGGNAALTGSWGDARARASVALRNGTLAGGISGDAGSAASFGATLAGTPQSPELGAAFVAAGTRYRNFEINGNGRAAFAGGTVRVNDAVAAVGPLFLAVAGTVTNLLPQGGFAPRYDLTAQLHSSDVNALLATIQPKAAALVQGSVDADVRVHGTGLTPSFAGSMNAPEASINGLAIRDLRGWVQGDARSIGLTGGQVLVGSTALRLHGFASLAQTRGAVSAPQADLSDFNDFFDTGDTLAGTGYLAAAAALNGTRVASTAGAASLSGARFRRLEFGNLTARWAMHRQAVVSALHFGGQSGEVLVAGRLFPQTLSVDLNGSARAMDLGTWLPMLDLHLPISGRLDAQTKIAGHYPDITMRLHAALSAGTAGPLPIERFEVRASASHGRGMIQSAELEVPSLRTDASGAFGFSPNDPLALTVHATSPNVGAFVQAATERNFHTSGTLDAMLHVNGTLAQPQVRAAVVLQSLAHERFTIPRITGEVDASRHWVGVRNGEIDFEHGRALASAEFPIHIASSGVRPGDGAMSASLTAQAIELSNFLALLPKGTQLAGHIDGTVVASGTVAVPALHGSLALRNGAFGGPLLEKTPVTAIGAELTFAGTQTTLQSQATAGGGTLALQGQASLADLHRIPDSRFSLQGRSENVLFDLPGFFRGKLDAALSVARDYAAIPQASGDVSISNARIPPNAFMTQQSGTESRPPLPNVAFRGLRIAAGNNVRVQSSNVDIGGTGDVAIDGTLRAPALRGTFTSTGGTLSFYRTFNLEKGEVSFAPSSGVIPDINASATTFVANPATAIRLRVTGPANSINLKMESQPPYSQEQILGLLVGAQNFGAVQGVQSTGQSFNASQMAGNLALGQLNTLFTRNVLQPFSSSLGGALGFTEVQLTTDIQAGLGISATKAFGAVNAIFSQTFGFPRTTSFGLEANPGACSGLRLIWFNTDGPTLLAVQQPQPLALNVLTLTPVTTYVPNVGQSGVAFSYIRKLPCVRGFF
ncbi:MAG: translocation/assembly module TamB domain-containing protein [Candidatus Cybelea sp.]